MTDLFRLYPTRAPFEVEGAGDLHLSKHAAPTWLVCHYLLSQVADPVKEVADMQVMPPDFVQAYATSQDWPG